MVLVTCCRPQPSGVYSYVRTLARGLGHRGHAVSVHTPVGPAGVGRAGAIATRVSRWAPAAPLLYGLAKSRVRAQAAKVPPARDLVWHAHDAAAALCVPSGAPLVLTVHGLLGEEPDVGQGQSAGLWRKHLVAQERIAYSRAQHICAILPDISTHIRHIAPEAVSGEVIGNAVDLTAFRPDPQAGRVVRRQLEVGDGECLVLFPSRPFARKGPDLPMRALAGLPDERRRRVRLLYLGVEDVPHELAQLAEEAGLAKQVVWHPSVPQERMPLYYQAADLVVLPSVPVGRWTEGQPLALIEAMACGCVVVASDLGGMSNLIQSGHDGLLTPVGRADALTEIFARWLDEPGQFAPMGEAARTTALARYGLDGLLDRHERIYLDVLRAPQPG